MKSEAVHAHAEKCDGKTNSLSKLGELRAIAVILVGGVRLWMGNQPNSLHRSLLMNHRAALIIILTTLFVVHGFSQDSTVSARCDSFGDPVSCVFQIMRGAPFDSIKKYIAPDAYVITGRTRQPLVGVLQSKDRATILNCDSTRTGWMQFESNISGDALSVTVKAIGAADGEIHYHSLVLYERPEVGWQIYLWHVGL